MGHESWSQSPKTKNESFYDRLGVKSDASNEEIRKAFIELSKKYHPSAEGGNEEKYKEITEAYNALKTPEKRAVYREETRSPTDPSNEAFEKWWTRYGKQMEDLRIGTKEQCRELWLSQSRDGKPPAWATVAAGFFFR